MKLSVSQIGWHKEDQRKAFEILAGNGFTGVEIAPTIVSGATPYTAEGIKNAVCFAQQIKREYGFSVPSMQSIWYGVQGSIFGEERASLLAYTKQAILYAKAIAAGSLVFGCPKNRIKPENMDDFSAVDFFRELGGFAVENNTLLSLEANPVVYGTNFMNTTQEAFEMVKKVDNLGCKLNLDFGTIIINGEDFAWLEGNVSKIGHVHISEPQLAAVQWRAEHIKLAEILNRENYAGYVSVEMKQQPLEILREVCVYTRGVFA